jgi:Flp pilus assembly protein TadD
VLRAVHARLVPGARVVVAEARAYPTQSLRAPARRAYSARSLVALLGAAGFDVDEHVGAAGPFVAVVAHAASGADAETLVEAGRAFARGNVTEATQLLERAAECPRTAVRMEALVTLGDVRLALGDGDGAARAYFAARALDADDPRPCAGIARLTLAMGDGADALALARAAVALDPACSAATCALAMALCASETSVPQGSSALRAAAALSPDDPAIAMAFAGSSVDADATRAAIFAMERTRRYGDPLPGAFHVLLAELLLREGRREDAILEARLADATAPGSPEVVALWKKLRA